MLLTEKVKIKTHTRLKFYYQSLGYDMSNDFVEIFIKDISKKSHIKVEYKCDNCADIITVNYDAYTKRQFKDFDTCKKCKNITLKKSLQNKYGVDNVFQLKQIKEKSKQTCLQKYGVEFTQKLDTVKEKSKQDLFTKLWC
jgi:hypothetical protein